VPELPEVETVRRGLVSLVKGYKIVAAHDLHPRALKPESIAPLKSIQGAKIIDLNRRGKFLWFVLDRPQVLVAHLGMSGQFLIHQQGHPRAKHVRAQFDLTKQMRKRELVFNDQRTFGWVSVEETNDGVPRSGDGPDRRVEDGEGECG
jgi:formamidopyrimidine-DNA glycosylase